MAEKITIIITGTGCAPRRYVVELTSSSDLQTEIKKLMNKYRKEFNYTIDIEDMSYCVSLIRGEEE